MRGWVSLARKIGAAKMAQVVKVAAPGCAQALGYFVQKHGQLDS
jgi:hypothetical protein